MIHDTYNSAFLSGTLEIRVLLPQPGSFGTSMLVGSQAAESRRQGSLIRPWIALAWVFLSWHACMKPGGLNLEEQKSSKTPAQPASSFGGFGVWACQKLGGGTGEP